MADLTGTESTTAVEVTQESTGNVLAITAANAAKVDSNQTQVGGATITLGQKTMAYSYPVTMASDQPAIPVSFLPAGLAIEAQLVFRADSSSPLVKDEWQDLLTYVVPAGYNFNGTWFYLFSGGVDRARTIRHTAFGSYNMSTNVFTDGVSLTAPRFASIMYLFVTTATNNVADTTITITYTNQDGVTGRVATLLLLKNTPAGRRIEIVLQSGDYGVQDVTNVTDNTANVGVFNLEGVVEMLYQGGNGTVVNTMYGTATAIGAIVFPEGQEIRLQYRSATAGNVERKISLTGLLVPV
jgi:hypothetical protein